MAPLQNVWAVLDAPAGKRLTPIIGELDIDEHTAAKLCAMSAATIDRRLAPDRKKMQLKDNRQTRQLISILSLSLAG
jgi:hypothetical protein